MLIRTTPNVIMDYLLTVRGNNDGGCDNGHIAGEGVSVYTVFWPSRFLCRPGSCAVRSPHT